jgi:hypothetical protein
VRRGAEGSVSTVSASADDVFGKRAREAEPADAAVDELTAFFVKKARVSQSVHEDVQQYVARFVQGGAEVCTAQQTAVEYVAFERSLIGCVSVTAPTLLGSWYQRPEVDRDALRCAWEQYAQVCAEPWARLRALDVLPGVWDAVRSMQAEAFAWVLGLEPRHLPSAPALPAATDASWAATDAPRVTMTTSAGPPQMPVEAPRFTGAPRPTKCCAPPPAEPAQRRTGVKRPPKERIFSTKRLAWKEPTEEQRLTIAALQARAFPTSVATTTPRGVEQAWESWKGRPVQQQKFLIDLWVRYVCNFRVWLTEYNGRGGDETRRAERAMYAEALAWCVGL